MRIKYPDLATLLNAGVATAIPTVAAPGVDIR
jgi:hypothetical protein